MEQASPIAHGSVRVGAVSHLTPRATPIASTGFTVLYEHQDSVADIVFVHGIQGHPYRTWACSVPNHANEGRQSLRSRFLRPPRSDLRFGSPDVAAGSAKGDVFWPRDLLPMDCPQTRIMTWGYESNVSKFFGGATDQRSVFAHAKDLLYDLNRRRSKCRGRSILFVTHSLGGIIVKEMLRRSQGDEDVLISDIVASTSAVLFLGTPHRGSSYAPMGETLRRIVSAFGFDTNDRNIRALHFDSVELELSREEFLKIWRARAFEVRTFQEAQGLTGVKGLSGKVVPDFSSTLDDPRERAQHIQGNHMSMCRFPNKENDGYSKVSGEIQGIIEALMNKITSNQVKALLATEDKGVPEKNCLQMLGFAEMNARSRRIDQPSKQTCDWLAELPSYQGWRKMQHLFIWLKGKAGSGKSTLVKHTFHAHTSSNQFGDETVAAFFFDAHGTALEKSLVGLFRSVIHQICSQNRALLLAAVEIQGEKVTGPSNQGWSLDLVELLDIFSVLLVKPEWRPTFLYLDGLDEGDEKEIRKLLSFLDQRLHGSGVGRLNVFLSSRHYPNITLQNCPEIHTKDYNSTDIARHLEQTLPLASSDRETVKGQILGKASGVFLWVNIVIDMMKKADDDGETLAKKRQILQAAPAELEELYIQLLSRLSPSEKLETYQIAKWVAFAKRPMSPLELCFALALDEGAPICSYDSWKKTEYSSNSNVQMEQLIRSRSRGLVEINSYDTLGLTENVDIVVTTVQFIHESVAAFLVDTGLDLLRPLQTLNVVGLCHDEIAKCCLQYLEARELEQYLNFNEDEHIPTTTNTSTAPIDTQMRDRSLSVASSESSPVLQQEAGFSIEAVNEGDEASERDTSLDIRHTLPFLSYAVTGLFHHVCEAEKKQVYQSYLVDHVLFNGPVVLYRWYAFSKNLDPDPLFLSIGWSDLLQIAAARGIGSCVTQIVHYLENRRVNAARFDRDTSLFWAVSFGHTETALYLLGHGADPNKGNGVGKTPFHAACESGNLGLIQAFLHRQANVTSETIFGSTVLHSAAEHGNSPIITTLLNAGANLEARNMDGETPLGVAARLGKTGAVSCLLQAGANVDAKDNLNQSSLFVARTYGHTEVQHVLQVAGASLVDESLPRSIDRAMTASPKSAEFRRRQFNSLSSPDRLLRVLHDWPIQEIPERVRLLRGEDQELVLQRQAENKCLYCGSLGYRTGAELYHYLSSSLCPFWRATLLEPLLTMTIDQVPPGYWSAVESRRRNATCFYCNCLGHFYKDCPVYSIDLISNDMIAHNAALAIVCGNRTPHY